MLQNYTIYCQKMSIEFSIHITTLCVYTSAIFVQLSIYKLGIVMSRISAILYASDRKLSRYFRLLYELGFMEKVLEQNPEMCIVTDNTELRHFGVESAVIKKRIFELYGYRLKYADQPLWRVLKSVSKHIKTQRIRQKHRK